MNKIIVGAGAVLVLIIALTLFVTNIFNNTASTAKNQPSPAPTVVINRRGVNPTRSDQKTFNEILQDKNSGVLPQQQARFEELKGKLPFTSPEFDMQYDSETDTFFVQLKTDGAEDKLKEFLSQNGLLDVYLKGSNKILATKDPISQAITQLKNDINADLNHGSDSTSTKNNSESLGGKQPLRKDEQQFVDTMKTLTDFKMSENPPAGKNSGAPETGRATSPPNLGGPNTLGYYQMPEPTADEYVFSPGTCPAQRWGQKDLINVIYATAKAWKARFPDSRLRVGDLNASGHNSHRWGVAVDISITNQSAANTSGDRNRSIELGKMFINTNLIKNIWYCDSAVNSAVMGHARANNLSLQQMACVAGHYDHFHVDVIVPRGPESTPGC